MQIILAHSNSDFDAVAAQHAAARLWPEAQAVLAPQLAATVAEFIGLYRDVLAFVSVDELEPTPISQLILVDTDRMWGSWELAPDAEVTIIDHHPPSDAAPPQAKRHPGDAGASTTMLVQLLLERGEAISPTEATLFALGIYEDTGNLTYAETTPADAQVVAALLERGADLAIIRRYRNRGLTEAQHQALAALQPQLCAQEIAGRAVLSGWADLKTHTPDLSGLAERLRDLYRPSVIFLALGLGDGTQVILRAEEGVLDCGAWMAAWGGGGHAMAAAAWVDGRGPEDVYSALQAELSTLIIAARTAQTIMTRGLKTLAAEARVAEAAELLRRWDFGAIPVLDEQGRLLGDIGRKELLKAERHGLKDAPVRRYLWRRPATIGPEATLAEVRRIIADEQRGRAYVLNSERQLLGLITRGDLLHHTERRTTSAAQADHWPALEQAIDAAQFARILWAAEHAGKRGWAVYIVGGFVRDLLLEREPGDIDLVVEGDAIAVARALAEAQGGEVRTHEPFGTATVAWGGNHLDFITARTEFYEHPSALPQIEATSLRHDLHRRDFTINTLAIGLTGSRRGHLYDFYGGMRDLKRKLIRVLHNLSFIDDPTRLLRAVRLAARLGFAIEPRTGELIGDALEQDLLRRTSPARIRHELRLLLDEDSAAAGLGLLAKWGILTALHQRLMWGSDLSERFARLEDWTRLERRDGRLLVLLGPLSPEERQELGERYLLPARERALISQWSALEALLPSLEDAKSPGELDALLRPFDGWLLRFADLAATASQHQALETYLGELRPQASLIGGAELRAAGLAPGPSYGPLIAEARAAQLNGAFSSHEEAAQWLRRRLDQA